MNLFTRLLPSLSALTLAVILATPHTAAAEDKKGYHATACSAADGIETDFSRSSFRVTRTGSSGNGKLYCPVIYDAYDCGEFLGFNGCVPITSARVELHDQHFAADVSCTLSAHQRDGATLSSWGYQTARSNLAPGAVTLEMSVSRPPSEGSYSLTCSLPTNNGAHYTKLYGYSVTETD